jgi:hypothetical protein
VETGAGERLALVFVEMQLEVAERALESRDPAVADGAQPSASVGELGVDAPQGRRGGRMFDCDL